MLPLNQKKLSTGDGTNWIDKNNKIQMRIMMLLLFKLRQSFNKVFINNEVPPISIPSIINVERI